jgi:hypothetical protein
LPLFPSSLPAECDVFDLFDELPAFAFFLNPQLTGFNLLVQSASGEIPAKNDGSSVSGDIYKSAGTRGNVGSGG